MDVPTPTPALYPATWNFRVIVNADAASAVRTALAALLAERHEMQNITEGGTSKGGRYTTWVVPIKLQNRADMEQCSALLKRIPGVKFVL